ncbi:pentapeptide repeat-containing protein [Legionella hackeliae]|uniref:Pentapeptide repeat protein n=1 Tax=Legionella hackeliae TaxID=449 RepID=A0A0A8UXV6_LEGHA|nr:pentapeptide repeat-containing protein [Legionella hackeliae]KTD12556.1 Pentapeptide repeats (8 copies) [Legionella hackeliae]CEK11972.1 protein of unknown function [Legionella hackeliae]STX48751.1 secreted effector protein PipB2 [Legionella hackeliae]
MPRIESDELVQLARKFDKIQSSDMLGSFFSNLDELEHRVHLKVNQILNTNFDPTLPLSKQDVAKQLKNFQEQLNLIFSLRIKAISQYRMLRDEEKIIVWTSYSKTTDANPNSSNKPLKPQMQFEIFEILSTYIEEKSSSNIHPILLADFFKLLSFPAGLNLLNKFRNHLQGGRIIEFQPDEDYVAAMVPETPSDAFAFQTQGSADKVKAFSGFDLDDLKSYYVKDPTAHSSHGTEPKKALEKVIVAIPKTQNMEIIFAKGTKQQIVYSISPSYRALYHELTHAHRSLKGSHKKKYAFPAHLGIFYSKNAEELWTINLGKTSEKALSRDDQLPERIGHFSITLYKENDHLTTSLNQEQVRRTEMKILACTIKAQLLSGKKDFIGIAYQGQNRPRQDRLEVDLSWQKGNFIFDKANALFFIMDSKLSNSSFRMANLLSSKFYRSELLNVDFTGSVLDSIELQNSNLSSSQLNKCNLLNASLSTGNFDGVQLTQAKVNNSKITNCSFLGANFSKSQISNTVFENVDFSGVILDDVLFNNVQFKNCRFTNAIASKMKMMHCSLEDVSFHYANMDQCSIDGELKSVDFVTASMNKCIVTNSLTGHSPSI